MRPADRGRGAAGHTEGWTEEDIEYSCDLDRSGLERGQEEFRAGPGEGRYAVHPHLLEVTLPIFLYPAWHRLVNADNASDPPRFEVAPIPGSFCDR